MLYLTMKNIIPITDLQRQAGQLIARLSENEEPIVITQRGRASAVIISVERYTEMEEDLKKLDEFELLGMIEDARQEKSNGQIISQDEVKKRLNFTSKK